MDGWRARDDRFVRSVLPWHLEELEQAQPCHPFEIALERPNHPAPLGREGTEEQIPDTEALTLGCSSERPLFDETPGVVRRHKLLKRPQRAMQAGNLASARPSEELDLHRKREGNFIVIDQRIECLSYQRIAKPQVGNPDRRIDEDQDRLLGRRRERDVSTDTSTFPASDLSS